MEHPAFAPDAAAIDKLMAVAWKNSCEYQKSPRKQRASADFANPSFELAQEWLAARERVPAPRPK